MYLNNSIIVVCTLKLYKMSKSRIAFQTQETRQTLNVATCLVRGTTKPTKTLFLKTFLKFPVWNTGHLPCYISVFPVRYSFTSTVETLLGYWVQTALTSHKTSVLSAFSPVLYPGTTGKRTGTTARCFRANLDFDILYNFRGHMTIILL